MDAHLLAGQDVDHRPRRIEDTAAAPAHPGTQEPLPKLPVARAVWKPKPDLATAAETWITAGGPHHTVLSTAVDTDQLTEFAHLLGVELLMIDGSTTRRDFADRIRWNQAYYRLAQGF